MNTEVKKETKVREILKLFSTIISWTVFVLLLICAGFLIYYFVATRIYMAKGSGYEPKFSLYTIISPSMVPNINVYDVVVDIKVDKPEDIKIDDVITFASNNPELNGGTITHRVIAITKDNAGKYYYLTKGDNNLVEDDSQVEFNNIVGKVALKIPQLGRVQFFLATPFGWLVLIIIPALYIIIKDIVKIIKLRKELRVEKKEKRKVLLLENGTEDHKLLPYNKKDNITASPTINSQSFFIDDDVEIDDLPTLKE